MAGILFENDERVLLDSVKLALRLRNKPKLTFLECGCASGDTSKFIIDFVNKSKFRHEFVFKYYGIDSTDLTNSNPVVQRKEFKFIKGYTFQVADQIPKDLDWIFIDACHCAMCVKRDIDTYAHFLSDKGILVFHDASPLFQGHHPQNYGKLFKYHDNVKAAFGVQVLEALKNTNFKSLNLSLWKLALPQPQGGVQIYIKSTILKHM